MKAFVESVKRLQAVKTLSGAVMGSMVLICPCLAESLVQTTVASSCVSFANCFCAFSRVYSYMI